MQGSKMGSKKTSRFGTPKTLLHKPKNPEEIKLSQSLPNGHPRILAIRSALPMAMLAKAAPSVAMSELIPGSPVEQQHLPPNGPSR